MNKEAGDIVGIGLRGAPPELNSVTLDGTRTAGATTGFSPQGDRAPLIDQVPSELIKEIEITKGNTPDQSADSLGGTVNLVTRKPLDKRGFHLAGSIEANYGDLRKEWSPTVNILASNTWETGAGTFGLQLSYSKSKLKTVFLK